jgi:hypothetical protein
MKITGRNNIEQDIIADDRNVPEHDTSILHGPSYIMSSTSADVAILIHSDLQRKLNVKQQIFSSRCGQRGDLYYQQGTSEEPGHAVALCYKPGGRRFDFRWSHWIFSICLNLPVTLWPWSRLSRWQKWVPGIFQRVKGGRPARKADNLTAICEPIV